MQESGELIEQMRHAIHAEDADLLRRAAHTLKGGCSYFGADKVEEQAQRLEDAGRQGELSAAEAIYAPLARDVVQLRSEICRQWGC